MSRGLVAVLVALVAGAALALSWQHRDRDVWEGQVAGALATRDSLKAEAEAAILRAVEAEHRAHQSLAWADSVGQRARERVVVVRGVEVPAPAVPYTAPRDSIIDVLIAEADTLRQVVVTQEEVISYLRGALAMERASAVVLEDVLHERPGADPWWKPTVTAGAFVGACSNGRACSGLGVTVGWRIPWG